MLSTINKICALQLSYSSRNTPEMIERGRLVRTVLASELREKIPTLQIFFDDVFDDLAVEASDGIGRKTEAPWVRLFSRAMSPNPRNGFYIVIHFAADGSGFFVTLGCGSTVWSGGDLRPVSDSELKSKTDWARTVINAKWGSIDPFENNMVLGAKAPLTKTFEKATAIAKFLTPKSSTEPELDAILGVACRGLNEIYIAQLEQRDITPAEQDALQIKEITKPLYRTGYGQGFGLSALDRKAIELHAMKMAVSYLQAQGFVCTDTSANQPFDLLAKKGEQKIKVEVKGTTSDICKSIMMTKNEVTLHRQEVGNTALIIVSSIRLNRSSTPPQTSGGQLEALLSWNIDAWTLEPMAYRVSR